MILIKKFLPCYHSIFAILTFLKIYIMKMTLLRSYFISLSLILLSTTTFAQSVYTTYLWHMDQPVYWPDYSKDKPDSKQFAEESQRLKLNGTNQYPGSSVAHPSNDLQGIFNLNDRIAAYQTSPRDAINSIKDLTNAGAQVSYSGGLMDNVQSLGAKSQWGYTVGWMNNYKEAISWKTSGNLPRLDVVNFTYDHALSPLVSDRTLVKEIKAHQYTANKYYGSSSKGYWPAECAFSERIIKTLVTCGIQWSVIPNSHLARTLSDYVHPYGMNGNIDAPNPADIVTATGINWYDGTIDGRGVRLAAPYCYQAHKARYIDPASGTAYTIDVVPMCNYMSYVDGYSGANVSDVTSHVAAFSNTTQPSMVLLAHDGDNAWGGGYSYYYEAVNSFTHSAASAGYGPTTIQQFLTDHPVPATDIVHVEDGAWVNATSDWGHPQFINWLWPLYSTSTYRFNPNGWTEDAYNWSIITATENYVTMAEDLEGGNLSIAHIAEGGTVATNAEKAWHFYMGGLNSGFMYYGTSEDMIVKEALTGNNAITYAQKVLDAHSGVDNTPPSVFIPQRFPYNPGGIGWGPTTSYTKVNYSSDFDVWTYAYDVSGLTSVKLKYRTDKDGKVGTQNQTYAGGSDVNTWQSTEMSRQAMAAAPTNLTASIFITPKAKADLCYASIIGMNNQLVDYYVEATDSKGNIFNTPIQHVYVGASNQTYNPIGQNITKSISAQGQSYTFAVSDFGFSSPKSNTFKGIKIVSLPATGSLTVSGTSATVGQLVTDVTQLTYTAGNTASSFTFSIVDSTDLVSLSNYAATFNLGSSVITITVKFQKPTSWTSVFFYAWTGTSIAVLGAWPGTAITAGTDGLYSYTFDGSINSVNMVFSNGSGTQTVDVTGIIASTCYQTGSLSGSKLTVKTMNCTTGIEAPQAVLKALVYPQPATNQFTVELPNLAIEGKYKLSIVDLSGNEIRRETFKGNTVVFERGNLKPGLYIVHISGEDSGLKFSSKLSMK
jgi:hypothetical protein